MLQPAVATGTVSINYCYDPAVHLLRGSVPVLCPGTQDCLRSLDPILSLAAEGLDHEQEMASVDGRGIRQQGV